MVKSMASFAVAHASARASGCVLTWVGHLKSVANAQMQDESNIPLPSKAHNGLMSLPEHWQASSDRRILAWVGTLATLTAAAVWIRNARL
jgi:hypothetical protein